MEKSKVRAQHWLPTDVPALRDKLLESWRNGVLEIVLTSHPAAKMHLPVYRRDEAAGVNIMWSLVQWMEWVVARLEEAELFYVTEDMTELVTQASIATPTYEVYRDRLPAEVGFVVFAKPFCAVPGELLAPEQRVELVAALWGPVPDVGGKDKSEPGLMCVTLQDSDVLLWTQEFEQWGATRVECERVVEDMRRAMGPLAYHEEYPMPFGTTPWGDLMGAEPGEPVKVKNAAVAALFTTWILMGQRITTVEQAPIPRTLRKQAARTGRPVPKVRLVTLRQASRKRPADEQLEQPGGSSRRYTVRWPVKGYGYWRETWYPSRERHELQYVFVPSYMKGPEGAPLVGGERVNVLRR